MAFISCTRFAVIHSLVLVAVLLTFTPCAQAQFAFDPHVSVRSNAAVESGNDVNTVILAGTTADVWNAFWIASYSPGNNGGQVYRARSTDNGVTWSAPVFIHTTFSNGLRLVKGKDGVLIACWHDAITTNRTFYTRSTDDGITWSSSVQFPNIPASPNYTPGLATNGNGVWVATWEGTTVSDYDIYFVRSTDNGVSWSSASILNSSFSSDGTADDRAAQPAHTTGNNWFVVWHSTNRLSNTLPAGKVFILISRSSDGGATWSAPTAVTPTGIMADSVQIGHAPTVATDGAGRWVLTMHGGFLAGGTGGDFDVFCSRSSNNGATWTDWEKINSFATTDTGNDVYPIVRYNNGRWACTWSSAENYGGKGTDIDTLFSQSFDNGVTWRPAGYVNPNAKIDTGLDFATSIHASASDTWLVGTYSAGVTGTDNDPFVLKGIGDLNLYPSTLNAGQQEIVAGPTAPVNISLFNDGFDDLDLNGFSVTGADAGSFTIVTPPVLGTIPPGTGITCTIQFDPDTIGLKSASAVFTTNVAGEPNVTLALSGEGVSQPEVTVIGGPLVFGNRNITEGATATQSIEIRNDGSIPLNFQGNGIELLGTNAGDFAFNPTPVIATLASGTNMFVTLHFDPSTIGAKAATLRISTNDVSEPVVDIALTGTGTDPEIDPSTSTLSFGSRDVDAGASTVLAVTINNLGSGDLNFIAPNVEIVGTDASSFAFSTMPVTSTITAGGNRAFSLIFDPSMAGAKSASLVFTTNDTDEPSITIPLSGNGIDQEVTVSPATLSFGSTDTDAGATASQIVTVQNDGSATLNFVGSGITLTGADSSSFQFAAVPATTSLAPGESRNVSIFFDPMVPGSASASLQIESDDTDEPTILVGLSGTGIDQEIAVLPAFIPFGDQTVGVGPGPGKPVTIYNEGTAPLNFTSINISGTHASEFVFGAPASTAFLAPGQSRTFYVRFSPAVLGVRIADLVITSDDTNEPTSTIPMSGSGSSQFTSSTDWNLYE